MRLLRSRSTEYEPARFSAVRQAPTALQNKVPFARGTVFDGHVLFGARLVLAPAAALASALASALAAHAAAALVAPREDNDEGKGGGGGEYPAPCTAARLGGSRATLWSTPPFKSTACCCPAALPAAMGRGAADVTDGEISNLSDLHAVVASECKHAPRATAKKSRAVDCTRERDIGMPPGRALWIPVVSWCCLR